MLDGTYDKDSLHLQRKQATFLAIKSHCEALVSMPDSSRQSGFLYLQTAYPEVAEQKTSSPQELLEWVAQECLQTEAALAIAREQQAEQQRERELGISRCAPAEMGFAESKSVEDFLPLVSLEVAALLEETRLSSPELEALLLLNNRCVFALQWPGQEKPTDLQQVLLAAWLYGHRPAEISSVWQWGEQGALDEAPPEAVAWVNEMLERVWGDGHRDILLTAANVRRALKVVKKDFVDHQKDCVIRVFIPEPVELAAEDAKSPELLIRQCRGGWACVVEANFFSCTERAEQLLRALHLQNNFIDQLVVDRIRQVCGHAVADASSEQLVQCFQQENAEAPERHSLQAWSAAVHDLRPENMSPVLLRMLQYMAALEEEMREGHSGGLPQQWLEDVESFNQEYLRVFNIRVRAILSTRNEQLEAAADLTPLKQLEKQIRHTEEDIVNAEQALSDNQQAQLAAQEALQAIASDLTQLDQRYALDQAALMQQSAALSTLKHQLRQAQTTAAEELESSMRAQGRQQSQLAATEEKIRALEAEKTRLLAQIDSSRQRVAQTQQEKSALIAGQQQTEAEIKRLGVEGQRLSQQKMALDALKVFVQNITTDLESTPIADSAKKALHTRAQQVHSSFSVAAAYEFFMSQPRWAAHTLSSDSQALPAADAALRSVLTAVLQATAENVREWDSSTGVMVYRGYRLSWRECLRDLTQWYSGYLEHYGLKFQSGVLCKANTRDLRLADLPAGLQSLIKEYTYLRHRPDATQDRDSAPVWSEFAKTGSALLDFIADLQIPDTAVKSALVTSLTLSAVQEIQVEEPIVLPGTHLMLLAQGNIQLPAEAAKNIINTSGRQGGDYKAAAARHGTERTTSYHGEHGLNGMAGQNAGNIVLTAHKKIVNIETLSCKAIGGNGGKGQIGGNGQQGQEGQSTPDAKADPLKDRVPQSVLAKARIPGLGEKIGETHTVITSEVSGDGGLGGQGGRGGEGGYGGDILLEDSERQVQYRDGELTVVGIARELIQARLQTNVGNTGPDASQQATGGAAGLPGCIGYDDQQINRVMGLLSPQSFARAYYDESYYKSSNADWDLLDLAVAAVPIWGWFHAARFIVHGKPTLSTAEYKATYSLQKKMYQGFCDHVPKLSDNGKRRSNKAVSVGKDRSSERFGLRASTQRNKAKAKQSITQQLTQRTLLLAESHLRTSSQCSAAALSTIVKQQRAVQRNQALSQAQQETARQQLTQKAAELQVVNAHLQLHAEADRSVQQQVDKLGLNHHSQSREAQLVALKEMAARQKALQQAIAQTEAELTQAAARQQEVHAQKISVADQHRSQQGFLARLSGHKETEQAQLDKVAVELEEYMQQLQQEVTHLRQSEQSMLQKIQQVSLRERELLRSALQLQDTVSAQRHHQHRSEYHVAVALSPVSFTEMRSSTDLRSLQQSVSAWRSLDHCEQALNQRFQELCGRECSAEERNHLAPQLRALSQKYQKWQGEHQKVFADYCDAAAQWVQRVDWKDETRRNQQGVMTFKGIYSLWEALLGWKSVLVAQDNDPETVSALNTLIWTVQAQSWQWLIKACGAEHALAWQKEGLQSINAFLYPPRWPLVSAAESLGSKYLLWQSLFKSIAVERSAENRQQSVSLALNNYPARGVFDTAEAPLLTALAQKLSLPEGQPLGREALYRAVLEALVQHKKGVAGALPAEGQAPALPSIKALTAWIKKLHELAGVLLTETVGDVTHPPSVGRQLMGWVLQEYKNGIFLLVVADNSFTSDMHYQTVTRLCCRFYQEKLTARPTQTLEYLEDLERKLPSVQRQKFSEALRPLSRDLLTWLAQPATPVQDSGVVESKNEEAVGQNALRALAKEVRVAPGVPLLAMYQAALSQSKTETNSRARQRLFNQCKEVLFANPHADVLALELLYCQWRALLLEERPEIEKAELQGFLTVLNDAIQRSLQLRIEQRVKDCEEKAQQSAKKELQVEEYAEKYIDFYRSSSDVAEQERRRCFAQYLIRKALHGGIDIDSHKSIENVLDALNQVALRQAQQTGWFSKKVALPFAEEAPATPQAWYDLQALMRSTTVELDALWAAWTAVWESAITLAGRGGSVAWLEVFFADSQKLLTTLFWRSSEQQAWLLDMSSQLPAEQQEFKALLERAAYQQRHYLDAETGLSEWIAQYGSHAMQQRLLTLRQQLQNDWLSAEGFASIWGELVNDAHHREHWANALLAELTPSALQQDSLECTEKVESVFNQWRQEWQAQGLSLEALPELFAQLAPDNNDHKRWQAAVKIAYVLKKHPLSVQEWLDRSQQLLDYYSEKLSLKSNEVALIKVCETLVEGAKQHRSVLMIFSAAKEINVWRVFHATLACMRAWHEQLSGVAVLANLLKCPPEQVAASVQALVTTALSLGKTSEPPEHCKEFKQLHYATLIIMANTDLFESLQPLLGFLPTADEWQRYAPYLQKILFLLCLAYTAQALQAKVDVQWQSAVGRYAEYLQSHYRTHSADAYAQALALAQASEQTLDSFADFAIKAHLPLERCLTAEQLRFYQALPAYHAPLAEVAPAEGWLYALQIWWQEYAVATPLLLYVERRFKDLPETLLIKLQQLFHCNDYFELNDHHDAVLRELSSEMPQLDAFQKTVAEAVEGIRYFLSCASYAVACHQKQEAEWLQFYRALRETLIKGGSLRGMIFALRVCSFSVFSYAELTRLLQETLSSQLEHRLTAALVIKVYQNTVLEGNQELFLTEALLKDPLFRGGRGLEWLWVLAENLLDQLNTQQSVMSLSWLTGLLQRIEFWPVHHSGEMLAQFKAQPLHLWGLCFKRLWIQGQLQLDITNPLQVSIIDAIVSLQKRYGEIQLHNWLLQLQQRADLDYDALYQVLKGFVAQRFKFEPSTLHLLKSKEMALWVTVLEEHAQAQQEQTAERSPAMLMQLMKEDQSAIGLAMQATLPPDLLTLVEAVITEYNERYPLTVNPAEISASDLEAERQALQAELEALKRPEDKDSDGLSIAKTLLNHDDDFKPLLLILYRAAALTKNPPRATQLFALVCYLKNAVANRSLLAEIATGEGKSLTTALLAIACALRGERVYVVTSSRVLAERDAQEAQQLCEFLGVTVTNNCDTECERDESIRKKRYEYNQVVFGDLSSFARDHLLTEHFGKGICEKRADRLLLDEADSMMIDRLGDVLYLSHTIDDLQYLQGVFLLIWNQVVTGDHWIYSEVHADEIYQRYLEARQAGSLLLPNTLDNFIDTRFKEWVRNAYHAWHDLDSGREYYVPSGGEFAAQAVIMDLQTGVEQFRSQWSNGTHQFLQIKHGLTPTDESLRAIFIANITYFKLFPGRILGMTGTLGDQAEVDLLRDVYGADFLRLPRFKREQYVQLEDHVVATPEAWCEEILREVKAQLEKEPSAADQTRIVRAEVRLKKCREELSQRKKESAQMQQQLSNLELKKKQLQEQEEALSRTIQSGDVDRGDFDAYESRREVLAELKRVEQEALAVLNQAKTLLKLQTELLEKIKNDEALINKPAGRAVMIICADRQSVGTISQALRLAYPSQCKEHLYTYDSYLQALSLRDNKVYPGDMIVTTNIGARGTHLPISEALLEQGGLHVILAHMPNLRGEEQAFRRAARAGEPGSGCFIICDSRVGDLPLSVELLREERDEQELMRLTAVLTHKIPKAEFEEELFQCFVTVQKEVVSHLSRLPEQDQELLRKEFVDRWAFWLNDQEALMEKATPAGWETVRTAFGQFKTKELKLAGELQQENQMSLAGLMRKGYRYAEQKRFQEAMTVYQIVIDLMEAAKKDKGHPHPSYSGFPYYYKAYCLLSLGSSIANKKQAKQLLKKAIEAFENKLRELSGHQMWYLQVVQYLKERRGAECKEEGKKSDPNDFYLQWQVDHSGVIDAHLRAAQDFLSKPLSMKLMQDQLLSFFRDPQAAAHIILSNMVTQLPTHLKAYRFSAKVSLLRNEQTGVESLCYKGQPLIFPSDTDYQAFLVSMLQTRSLLDAQGRVKKDAERNVDVSVLPLPSGYQVPQEHGERENFWETLIRLRVIKEPTTRFGLYETNSDNKAAYQALAQAVAGHIKSLIEGAEDLLMPVAEEKKSKVGEVIDNLQEKARGVKQKVVSLVSDSPALEPQIQALSDQIAKALLTSAGSLREFGELQFSNRPLSEIFKDKQRLPPVVEQYMNQCCGLVLELGAFKPWWNWAAFSCALLGAAQIALGAVLCTTGVGAFAGRLFINEGIGDICYAVRAGISGEFDWSAYGQHKLQSVLVSSLSLGFMQWASRGGTIVKSGLSVGQVMVKEMAAAGVDIAADVAINVALSKLVSIGLEWAMQAMKKTLEKIWSGERVSAALQAMERTLTHLGALIGTAETGVLLQRIFADVDLDQMSERLCNPAVLAASRFITVKLEASKIEDKLQGKKVLKFLSKGLNYATVVPEVVKIFQDVTTFAPAVIERLNHVLAVHEERLANGAIPTQASDPQLQLWVQEHSNEIKAKVLTDLEQRLNQLLITYIVQKADRALLRPRVERMKSAVHSKLGNWRALSPTPETTPDSKPMETVQQAAEQFEDANAIQLQVNPQKKQILVKIKERFEELVAYGESKLREGASTNPLDVRYAEYGPVVQFNRPVSMLRPEQLRLMYQLSSNGPGSRHQWVPCLDFRSLSTARLDEFARKLHVPNTHWVISWLLNDVQPYVWGERPMPVDAQNPDYADSKEYEVWFGHVNNQGWVNAKKEAVQTVVEASEVPSQMDLFKDLKNVQSNHEWKIIRMKAYTRCIELYFAVNPVRQQQLRDSIMILYHAALLIPDIAMNMPNRPGAEWKLAERRQYVAQEMMTVKRHYIVPLSWPSHALYAVHSPESDGHYQTTIYNGGDGVRYHYREENHGINHAYPYVVAEQLATETELVAYFDTVASKLSCRLTLLSSLPGQDQRENYKRQYILLPQGASGEGLYYVTQDLVCQPIPINYVASLESALQKFFPGQVSISCSYSLFNTLLILLGNQPHNPCATVIYSNPGQSVKPNGLAAYPCQTVGNCSYFNLNISLEAVMGSECEAQSRQYERQVLRSLIKRAQEPAHGAATVATAFQRHRPAQSNPAMGLAVSGGSV